MDKKKQKHNQIQAGDDKLSNTDQISSLNDDDGYSSSSSAEERKEKQYDDFEDQDSLMNDGGAIKQIIYYLSFYKSNIVSLNSYEMKTEFNWKPLAVGVLLNEAKSFQLGSNKGYLIVTQFIIQGFFWNQLVIIQAV